MAVERSATAKPIFRNEPLRGLVAFLFRRSIEVTFRAVADLRPAAEQIAFKRHTENLQRSTAESSGSRGVIYLTQTDLSGIFRDKKPQTISAVQGKILRGISFRREAAPSGLQFPGAERLLAKQNSNTMVILTARRLMSSGLFGVSFPESPTFLFYVIVFGLASANFLADASPLARKPSQRRCHAAGAKSKTGPIPAFGGNSDTLYYSFIRLPAAVVPIIPTTLAFYWYTMC